MMIHGIDETVNMSYTIRDENLFYDAMLKGNLMGFRLNGRNQIFTYPLIAYHNFSQESLKIYQH